MTDYLSAFRQLLYERLIPEFCADQARRLTPTAFEAASLKISEYDARWFLMGFDADLTTHVGRGQYQNSNNGAKEQFFWEGPRALDPRPFKLWLEPVITVGCLARLHFEYGWPRELIGAQSPDFAFDVVTRLPERTGEYVAGEVKKSPREVARLIDIIAAYGADRASEPPSGGAQLNAYRKLTALRSRRPRLFWAIGPDALSYVFEPHYHDDNCVELKEANPSALTYPEIRM